MTTCPNCETRIPADAPGGICPSCVIGLGLSDYAAVTQDSPGADLPSSHPIPAFVPPTAADLDALFEHLEVTSLLGQGGMGAVYHAKQISLDRAVAVKILPPYAGNDPAFQERFQREARALARLTHPNIVMVFEFGQVKNMYYFVMEYVDGVNLREAIAAGGLTTRESMKVIPQICEALQFAHDAGIVHRDIKPENIMLDTRGRVKITDFGLAKLLEQNAINFTLTSTNQVLGTVKYMAPEQIENPGMVDHRSDIYSLGVVFYELLTGELPLGRFDPPSTTTPSNQPLDSVVMRTLEKQPSNRFQNASEIKTAVESVVIDESSPPPAKSPQPNPAAGSANSSSRPRLPSLNFQLHKVFAGFGRGKGLLRIDLPNQELILDIEIKDVLGGLFRSEFKQVRIGLDHILAFKPEFAWYSHPQLEIQTDYFQEFAQMPGAENGKILLQFEYKDRKRAAQYCEQVTAQLDFEDVSAPKPETKSDQSPTDADSISNELMQPYKLLRVAVTIDLVFALLAFCGSFLIHSAGRAAEDGAALSLCAVVWLCCGAFQMHLSRCVRSMNHRRTILIGGGILMLPFHVGAFVAIPAVVWLFIKLRQKRTIAAFENRQIEEASKPALRSSVYADPGLQLDLRTRLATPTRRLGIIGLVALIAWGILAAKAAETHSVLAAILSAASAMGIVNLLGAVVLKLSPSLFWARTVAHLSMLPISLFFLLSRRQGRAILNVLEEMELETGSGNPYLDKDEGFSVTRPR